MILDGEKMSTAKKIILGLEENRSKIVKWYGRYELNL